MIIPLEELRTMPLMTLARKYGCHFTTVCRQRRKHGITFDGEPLKPGRPDKYDWSLLDPALSTEDNAALVGCANLHYVRLRLRRMRGDDPAMPTASDGRPET